MRNKIINIILVLCVLAGVGILVYPFVSNMLHDRKQDEIITEYDEQMENLAEDEKAQMLEAARQYNEDLIGNIRVYETFWKNVEDAGDSGTSETDTARFSRLYEQMTAYNEQIFTEKQKNLCDPWSYEQSSFDLTRYGIEDNVAATIEIPRMDVELPIYLGDSGEYGSWRSPAWADFSAGGRRKYELCDSCAQRVPGDTHVSGDRETSAWG